MNLTDPEELEAALNQGVLETLPDEIRAFAWTTLDETEVARVLVREMSGPDRAVLAFHLTELSRLVQEEEQFRTTQDRRAARLSHPDSAYPSDYDS